MRHAASLQTAHVGIEAIEDDLMRLEGAQYRAVLEVGSVNFGLMGGSEQEATVAGFAAFLNSLAFPVQMVVRAMPIDVEGYLSGLERRALSLPEDLAALAHDHVLFLRRMARSRNGANPLALLPTGAAGHARCGAPATHLSLRRG